MTKYICKCGRTVTKSTNADNTGNRDTAGCEGCPYLLPWGPMVWDERQKAYTQDVKGQECRMSPIIEYATTYYGRADDKGSLHIVSLDLDFLDEVQAWIYDHANETLRADFSRGSMRGIEFSDKGRYSLSVLCAQNKKGVAAKAALLEEFFAPDKRRRDMTTEQEKAHILAAIEAGKARAQRKDTAMKKKNDRCPLQQECERTCKVIGHERDCDYYVNNRYGTDGIPDQDEILEDEDRRMEMELEEKRLAAMSIERAEPIAYCNEYGTIFAVREHKGAPDLMCKPKGADTWTLSGVLAAVKGEAYTTADLQEVLDEYARAHRWQKVDVEEQVKSDEDVLTTSPERIERKESVCVSKTTFAPSGAAAVTTDGSAAAKCGVPDAETRTTPADASGAQLPQPLAQSAPRQTEHATDTAPAAPSVPVFDYSGLDAQTVEVLHVAEREILTARQTYICRVSAAVAAAHEAVVANCENGERGQFASHENTFLAWCASVGLKKDAAYRLLQVNALLTGATPEEQATLEAASPSLLYAAAKPSAPEELVQAVKDGDITTHKQYQEALAEIRAKDAKIQELMEVSKDAARQADEARAWAKKAKQEAALDRKEREDAHEKAMHYKAECDRRAQEQQRVEGLLSTREEQLRQAQQEAQNAARTIQRKQEAIEELDEIARERLEQIEALEKGRTIEAQVSDPEEVRRQAEALARELAATETAGLQEENRQLRSCAPAVQRARTVLVAVIAQIMLECDKLEADDEEGGYALIELAGELLSWSADIKERVMAAAGHEEDGYDTDEN